jgi:hypothetical protein
LEGTEMETGHIGLFTFIGTTLFVALIPHFIQWSKKIPAIKKHWRRFWEWQCKKYGCITIGSYYGMPQAHCRRCGKKTSYAADFCEDKIEPWGEYK